jgi:hypothetical protein
MPNPHDTFALGDVAPLSLYGCSRLAGAELGRDLMIRPLSFEDAGSNLRWDSG